MGYTTPNTVTSSDVLTAALWNTQIRDNFESMPRGVVGKATQTTAQIISSGTITDITGLSVSWTATTTRLYLTTFVLMLNNLGAASTTPYTAYLRDASGTVKSMTYGDGWYPNVHWSFYETGLSGLVTRKVSASISSGSMRADANSYTANVWPQIIVMDVGPA